MRLVDLPSNDSLGLNKWLFRSLNDVPFQEFLLVRRFWASRGIWTTETLLRKQNVNGYKLTLNVKAAAVILNDTQDSLGSDPEFSLGGGAPLRNDVTDRRVRGEVNKF